jgi:UDP-3-O-[3-hydroxymyristoyl] glucosamine N-acyltransferase
VGAAGHISIGDQAMIAAQGGVTKSLPGKEVYFGMPAVPARIGRERVAHINRLKHLYQRVKELEEQVAALREQGNSGD